TDGAARAVHALAAPRQTRGAGDGATRAMKYRAKGSQQRLEMFRAGPRRPRGATRVCGAFAYGKNVALWHTARGFLNARPFIARAGCALPRIQEGRARPTPIQPGSVPP